MDKINLKEMDLKSASKLIKGALNGAPVEVSAAEGLHGLAAGLKQGEVIIRGSAGDYLGALNDGSSILVEGNVGKYLGDNMTRGTIRVKGNTGFGPGMYCYGGTLIVEGDAGDFSASMNKGADIIVAGNVGDEVATYMLAGTLIVLGNAGSNFANYLIRGYVYILGEWQSLGHNTRVEALTEEDLARLEACLERNGIKAATDGFKKIVAASEKPFYH